MATYFANWRRHVRRHLAAIGFKQFQANPINGNPNMRHFSMKADHARNPSSTAITYLLKCVLSGFGKVPENGIIVSVGPRELIEGIVIFEPFSRGR